MGKLSILRTFPYNFLAIFFLVIGLVIGYSFLNEPQSISYVPIPTSTITPSPVPTPRPTPIPPKPTKSVVFLGGSITAGAGATSYEDSWASLLSFAYKRKFPNYSWIFYNAGVGGTPSWYGLIRLQEDVISKNPDIIYIDFAVNDSDYSYYPHPENSGWYPFAEALIRRIRVACPGTQIYVWIFTRPEGDSTMTTARKEARDNWIALAQHYDLFLLRFDDAIYQDIGSNNPSDYQTDQFFTNPGNVHPNDAGHQLAARYAEKHLSPLSLQQPKSITDYAYIYPEAVNYEKNPLIVEGASLHQLGNWKIVDQSLESLAPGDEISYSGNFCSFGLDTNYGENAGKASWAIDGNERGMLDFSNAQGQNRVVANVGCGEHTLTIRVLEGYVRINRLLVI